MRWISIVFLSCLLQAICGCSIVPRQADVTRKTTFEVVEQIRCEAKRAVVDYGYYYKTAAIAYEFTFDVSEENNNSLISSWQQPFISGGGVAIGTNAGLNLVRRTTRTFKLVDTFDQLKALLCEIAPAAPNISYPIAGDIGIYEVVGTFIRLQNLNNRDAGQVFTFGDTLRFTTVVSGGISPKLTLVPVAGRFGLAEGAASFGASRSDIHQVTIGLAGSRPGEKGNTPSSLLGSSLDTSRLNLVPSSSLLSTTLLQAGADPKDRALIELDRQRILELQARSQNLLVGP